MRRVLRLLGLAVVVSAGSWLGAGVIPAASACPDLLYVREAREGDANAIAKLREMGPDGLASFVAENRIALQDYRASAAAGHGRYGKNDAWKPMVEAMDAIAAQRDASWSELYWFTDLEKAKAHAQSLGRPILSLRLLGRLDEELSCANSRFFRAALYANVSVADMLRDRFVLHWETVRPAPVITIDYGDGRELKTTITGNSVHYVLTPDGRVVDALPGLWAPQEFQITLAIAANTAVEAAEGGELSAILLAKYHESEVAKLTKERLEQGMGLVAERPALARVGAINAGLLAFSKSGPEMMMLNRMTGTQDVLREAEEAEAWRLASRKVTPAQFDDRSRTLMRAQITSPTEGLDSSFHLLTAPAFESSVRVDSLRNRLDLRPWILKGLARDPSLAVSLGDLNELVYKSAFQTPRSDPWLGMYEPARYSAIWGGGVTEPSALPKLATNSR